MVHKTENDLQWYKKNWTLDIQDMSWVEYTAQEVDFVVEALELCGQERVLDLACGFGRHALELARRGYTVVGVDFTDVYVAEARRLAAEGGLTRATFMCADVRDVAFQEEFDVVLNLADGAIGYLETDAENLKIFDRVTAALKPGGKHLMSVCSGDYARKHFPRRHWEIGQHSLSLADFDWDGENSRMVYKAYTLRYGEVLEKPLAPEEKAVAGYTRLYTVRELDAIFGARGMHVWKSYGDYDVRIPASEDQLMLVVCSQKLDG